MVCGEERLTWSALQTEVRQLAGALHGAGVGPGDRVLWMGQNCHRVLQALAACAHIGAVFCPVNWRQSSAELAFVLDDADPKLVFWQEEEVGEAIGSARDAASTSARWIQHDGVGHRRRRVVCGLRRVNRPLVAGRARPHRRRPP